MKHRHVVVLCLLAAALGSGLIPANAGSEKKLERRLKKAEKAITSLQAKVQEQSLELGDLRGEQEDLSESVDALSASLNSLATRVTSSEGKITSLTSRTTSAEGDINDLESRTDQLDVFGDYTGSVDAYQVHGPFSCSGDAARWGSGFPQSLSC